MLQDVAGAAKVATNVMPQYMQLQSKRRQQLEDLTALCAMQQSCVMLPPDTPLAQVGAPRQPLSSPCQEPLTSFRLFGKPAC